MTNKRGNISDETDLRKEIKDILVELHIIRSVLDQQKDVSEKLFDTVASHVGVAKTRKVARDSFVNYYQERSDLNSRIRKIEKMRQDANRTYSSVSD